MTSTKTTQIPFNDLKRIVHEGGTRLIEAASVAITSGWWLNGLETRAFCEEFASYVGVSDCLGVANGSDALEIAMRAIIDVRQPKGREVVTVANAGGYSTIACRLTGLIPVYADIDQASQLMSAESALAAIGDDTALVVATHLYGGVIDVLALRSKMDAAGYGHVPILEDCAQAHGVRLNGRMTGSLGDIATFSFYPTKNLGALGDGGAIASSDKDLFERCRALHQYGWSSKYTISHAGGRNSRLDEVQAAVLRVMLPELDRNNARRVAILDAYQRAAGPGIQLVRSLDGTVGHLAVVLCKDRDGLKAHLAEQGISSEVHYPILDCDQPGWKDLPQRTVPGGLPVSRESVACLLTLPCFPLLRDEEVARVCDAVSGWRA